MPGLCPYGITVYNDATVIPSAGSTGWYFDNASGYLTFFNSISFNPTMSFWRYEG